MIYDQLSNLGNYRGISKNLDAMIDFLTGTADLTALPSGRIDVVSGNTAYINNNAVELALDQPLYEKHLTYIDIHIPLTLGERIEYAPIESINWPKSNEETTIAQGPCGTMLEMATGTFALFFPWDAHRPSIGIGKCTKLVCKILWE